MAKSIELKILRPFNKFIIHQEGPIYNYDSRNKIIEISLLKEGQDIEQLLLSELQEAEEHPDAGWDNTSMREEFGGGKKQE